MTDTTHAQGCWGWGPRHYECAVGQIERDEALLRQALEALEEARDALYEKKARRVRPGQGVCITGASGSDGNQH